jgi:ATP-dependent RNA helicase DeaD
VEQGYDPVDIAAAALKLSRVEEKQRPIAAVAEVKDFHSGNRQSNFQRGNGRKQGNGRASNGYSKNGPSQGRKTHEKGMVRLSMSAGKAQGIRPNDVVGTIAYEANIPGYTIGAIRIQDQHTLVDVPEQYVAQVLDKAGAIRIHRKAITIERA